MRDRRFRPCLDVLSSRIAPSTVALAPAPSYGTAEEPAPATPPTWTYTCCTDDPTGPVLPTSVGG